MPFSDSSLRPWSLARIYAVHLPNKTNPTIVDVGAGGGANLEFYYPWLKGTWIAIEAWEPYIERFELDVRYSAVINKDVRDAALPSADLYIFGDILEHLEADDAVEVWNRARTVSRYLLINIPIVHYEQGALHGNPYEIHRHHWSHEEIMERFEGITDNKQGPVVGAYWAKGLV